MYDDLKCYKSLSVKVHWGLISSKFKLQATEAIIHIWLPPKVIHNADMTRAKDYDYIGQIVTYTCKPGYEFTAEDLEPVNVTEYIREDKSK